MGKTHNKLSDLNNLLFEQLEKLADAENEEELKKEIDRSKAMSSVASQIIQNGALVLEAEKLKVEYRTDGNTQPQLAGLIGE